MPNLKLKVTGYKRTSVDATWENHELNGTLHPTLDDNIDGFSINKIIVTSIGSELFIENNGITVNNGDEIPMVDMNNGDVIIYFTHVFSSDLFFTAVGDAKYNIRLTINSIL